MSANENQANRMGGVLGYALGDGAAFTHAIPMFLGDEKSRDSGDQTGIDAVNNAVPGPAWTNASGATRVGWWMYEIDESRN